MRTMLKHLIFMALLLSALGTAWAAEDSDEAAADAPNLYYFDGESVRTGKLYLDDSYYDSEGQLHIVMSPAAVMQFQAEWPLVHVPVSFVSIPLPSTCPRSGGSTGAGPSAALGGEGAPINIEEFANFFDTARQFRDLDPEAFDQGFMTGYEQSMQQATPMERAFIEEIVPMSDGIGVDEAMDRISQLLHLIPTIGE